MVFESAVYTDVTSDDSVDHVDGFGFQAVSEGIGGDDRSVILADLLHQKSRDWPFDRDETAHPPTSAYLRTERGFYFSRGRSTGRTNSGRDGNQLTQAIVAREAGDLDPYRPAQISAAVNWRLERVPSNVSERWITPLEIEEEFDSAVLLDAFRADRWAMAALPSFVSMLQAAVAEPGTKVVVIHDDLETVMKWFAAGTLLLPAEDALGLGYRVFATDPFRTKAQLVGVHPELRPSTLAGAHVLDLTTETTSEIAVTPEAQRIAAWVAERDAFDAIELASLGGRWMKATDATTGARGAEMVLDLREFEPGREEWEIGISLIEGLAMAGLRDDLELYLDELADSVASYGIRGTRDAARAARAARCAADSGVTGLVEAVLVPSLEALAADPSAALAWSTELDASGGWQGLNLSEPNRIADLFADVILGAPPEAAPSLLHLAAPIATHLPANRLGPALERTALYLLSDPAQLRSDVEAWYGGREILERLRRGIVRTIDDRRAAARSRLIGELGAGAWDRLIPDAARDADSRKLAMWREAARLALEPVDRRAAAVNASVKRADADPFAPRLLPESWDIALGSTDGGIDIDLLVTWVRRVGLDNTLRGKCMSLLRGVLGQDPGQASAREIKNWLKLAEALTAVEPDNTDHAQTVAGLQRLLDELPTLTERVKDRASSFKSLFGGRKSGDPEQDSQKEEGE